MWSISPNIAFFHETLKYLFNNQCHFHVENYRRKRRRLEFEGTTCIQIEEACIDGKFVKLFNSGTKVSNLRG